MPYACPRGSGMRGVAALGRAQEGEREWTRSRPSEGGDRNDPRGRTSIRQPPHEERTSDE